jgi:hypothetical protein
MNLQENIQRIREMMGISEDYDPWFRRRFNEEELDSIMDDIVELIIYGADPYTAMYDAVREFIKSKNFPDIDEHGNEQSYWESYLKYEKPLIDYFTKRISNN